MNRKLKEHDEATRLILEGKYGYSNDNDVVKVCKYCNEVLKHKTEEYDINSHVHECKIAVGNALRLVEKIRKNDDIEKNKVRLINLLSDCVCSGEITRSLAKKIDKEFNLNMFC